ncbi:hypothetical protein P3X46_016735 [Hevea brasiliensis]|uniref:Uncharacterized protein n=1 Tax=Hevea brasiliensis TaxID=3981 RepID=A0ABQ9M413_HEVBR|nr:hypothetical protein P3X46_016735 [Hevea brasiliensis]
MIKQCLNLYQAASEQQVNFQKSEIYLSKNSTDEAKALVAGLLDVKIIDAPRKYLGLLSIVGHSKKEVFMGRVIMSRAGKEILLKTVVQAIPNYLMTLFLLPLDICDAVEKAMNRFWWRSGGNEGTGMHWYSWHNLCHRKEDGGISFHSLRQFNIALLAKTGWSLLTRPNALASILYKAHYYAD